MKNEVFFGDKGLTSTSANHLANVATECIQNIQSSINDMSFYEEKVFVAGASDNLGKVTVEGVSDQALEQIDGKLSMVGDLTAFIAWVREAIKAKNQATDRVANMSCPEWCRINGIEYPKLKNEEYITDSDIIEEMNIKERNEYLRLEALASVIGKYIHPNGAFSNARKDFQKKLQQPHKIDKLGPAVLVYDYSATVSAELVEEKFLELQNKHREINARLNAIKSSITERVTARNLENKKSFRETCTNHFDRLAKIEQDFSTWQIEENKRIAALKIVIPNELQKVYEFLQAQGKKES
jgi:hypothetical protein